MLQFFELIGEKPIVDLKLDNLKNLTHIDQLAMSFHSNTAIRNKARVARFAELMHTHEVLKDKK